MILQVAVQYRLNFWNRDFFNALEAREGGQIWHQAQILLALAAASVSLAVMAVWGRMTFQRLWRDWLTSRLIQSWLAEQRYQRAGFVKGQRQNAEYRITEDARLADRRANRPGRRLAQFAALGRRIRRSCCGT